MTAYKVGEWTVQPNLNRMFSEDKEVKLEPKVLALLNCFAKHPGEVLNRDNLVELAWEGVIVSDNTINYTIGMLRKALGDKARDPKYIQTVAKKGYRLIAEVTSIDTSKPVPKEDTQPIDIAIASTDGVATAVDPTPATTKQQPSSFAYLVLLIASIAVIASITYLVWPPKAEGHKFTKSTPITSLPGDEFDVSASSDGQWIYFAHIKRGDPFADIYRQPLDGGQPELVMEATPNNHESSPAVSPNGALLAYNRFNDDGCTLYLHHLNQDIPDETLGKCGLYHPKITWLSNEKFLLISAENRHAPGRVRQLDIKSGQFIKVTDTSDESTDYVFALSPDKKRIVIMRTLYWQESTLILKDLESGKETPLKTFPAWFFEITWLDNNTIIYTPNASKHKVEAMDVTTGVTSIAYNSQLTGVLIQKAIEGTGKLLITDRKWDTNIHRIPLDRTNPLALKEDPTPAILASTRSELMPKVSPDGQTLAFLSARSGSYQIWFSDLDGQNPRQLSSLPEIVEPYTFEWDGESKFIVLSTLDNRIYLLDTISGSHRDLTPDGMSAKNALFTKDNKNILFSSNESGNWQLWQIPAAGGSPTKLTTGGAYSARYTPDGDLIIAKYYKPGLWRFDTTTYEEELIATNVKIGLWHQWQPRKNGVYYGLDHEGRVQLFFYDWKTKESTRLFDTPHWRYTFEVSQDEKEIFFTRNESKGSDILILE